MHLDSYRVRRVAWRYGDFPPCPSSDRPPPPADLSQGQFPPLTRLWAIYRPSTQSYVDIGTDRPLTQAADSPDLQPGDIIYVSCGYGGFPANLVVSFGSDETWPIKIKPGVTVRGVLNPSYNAPIMITATAANPTAVDTPLFQFIDAPPGWNAADPTSKLIGVGLVGGEVGVLVKSKYGGSVDVELEDVKFSRQRVGVQVEADGAQTIPITVRDCTISSVFPATFHPLDLRLFEVGMRFWSLSDEVLDEGLTIGDIINLQIVGDYPASIMNPIEKLTGSPEQVDLKEYVPASGNPEYLNTMFVNTIFDTQSANPDFGPNLDSASAQNWLYDTGAGTHQLDLDKPHIASIRAELLYHPLSGFDTTDDDVAYEGFPAGLNPDQWFVDFASALSSITSVAPYLNAGGDLTEDSSDIEAKIRRPVTTQQRNKGGEEDQH